MHVAPPLTMSAVISDFLGTAPSLEAIIEFKLPEALEQRVLELLDHKRRDLLTADEHAELDEFTRMGHFINLVKLKARLQLAGKA